MTLLTAVAASLVPASRSRVAASSRSLPSTCPRSMRSRRWRSHAALDPSSTVATVWRTARRAARLRAPRNRSGALVRFALSCAPRLRAGSAAGALGARRRPSLSRRPRLPSSARARRRRTPGWLPSALRRIWPGAASWWSAGWRGASIRRPTSGCSEAAAPPRPCSAAAVDRIYPAEHAELAASICEHGALVSELGPGAPPCPSTFPLRNRIISGISLAVVVVEACEKSGSLITARYALEQGRDVMAVPGSVLAGRNRGSHGS